MTIVESDCRDTLLSPENFQQTDRASPSSVTIFRVYNHSPSLWIFSTIYLQLFVRAITNNICNLTQRHYHTLHPSQNSTLLSW